MALWSKADALSLSDGDLVSTFTDSSGNGRDWSQTGSLRPTYKTNIVNGKPVIRFGGTGWMKLLSQTFACKTIFIVFKQRVGKWYQGLFTYRTNTFARKVAGSADNGEITYSDTTSKLTDSSATCSDVYLNGVQRNLADFSTYYTGITTQAGFNLLVDYRSTSGVNTKNMVLGADAYDDGSGDRILDGDIAEILIYETVLNSTDRATVENYLNSKYAIY